MDIKEEEEIQKEFQLERAVLFTDAVFAIILTIMVLELRLPEGIGHETEGHIIKAYEQLILKFLAYTVSFFLVARFWIAHIKLFRFLKDYDIKLLALNLLFLFTVTLFPFAISLITSGINDQLSEFNWGHTIYILIFYSSIFTQSLITRYLLKNREKLCINILKLETNLKWKIQRINIALIPVLMVVVLVFNYYQTIFYYPWATVVVYAWITKRLSRAYYPGSDKGPLIAQLYRKIKTIKIKKRITPAG